MNRPAFALFAALVASSVGFSAEPSAPAPAAADDLSFCNEVLILHHSHVDIGYTHPQSMYWELQKDYLTAALDMLDRTEDWPDELSKPRWTAEVTAPVMRWLQTADGRGCRAAQEAPAVGPVRHLGVRVQHHAAVLGRGAGAAALPCPHAAGEARRRHSRRSSARRDRHPVDRRGPAARQPHRTARHGDQPAPERHAQAAAGRLSLARPQRPRTAGPERRALQHVRPVVQYELAEPRHDPSRAGQVPAAREEPELPV